MATPTRTIKARCLCGTVQHEISLPISMLPIEGKICSCTSCRRISGALCHTVFFLVAPHYIPDKAFIAKLTPTRYAEKITFHFCPTCGCHMLARVLPGKGINENAMWDVAWGIPTGTLEYVENVVDWSMHIHIQDSRDGGMADFLTSFNGQELKRWPGWYDQGATIPIGWRDSNRRCDTSENDRLHGRCHCGGVEFWIARPTPGCALASQYSPNLPPAYVSEEYLPLESETFYMRDRRTKYLAGLCACNSCRLASGMEIMPWAYVPTYQITQDREGRIPWTEDFGRLRRYTSSPGRRRYFCSGCGAVAFFSADHRPYLKDVAIGLVDAAEGARAETWFGWRTNRVGFRDDAIPRAESLVLGLEKGLREWQVMQPGKDHSGGSQSAGIR